MKQQEKNALSRQRIIEAAMEEFSKQGYKKASINNVCVKNELSKGKIYHYFKDKDQIYLVCVKQCFDDFVSYIKKEMMNCEGDSIYQLQYYFDCRLKFFMGNPNYIGIFTDVSLNPPPQLKEEIMEYRKDFDEFTILVLTNILNSIELRENMSAETIVEDFKEYMDFFNYRFRQFMKEKTDTENILKKHEERCHRQLDILLRGVMR